jgi:phosphoglycerate dehydrogenase-like enzyme
MTKSVHGRPSREPYWRQVLARWKRCGLSVRAFCGAEGQVVGRHGVGYDHIEVPAATERGILVLTTPGANTESVCQHAFGLMIGLSKYFPQTMAALIDDDRSR